MGSFNVACSVSNISIDCGDAAVFIPLTPNKYRYRIGDGNHTLIYSHCFYEPVTLPIFGTYDDYGRIKPIHDKNTEHIEKFFGVGIKDICDMQQTIEGISSGMFVHKRIFDVLVEKCSRVNEFGKANRLLTDMKGDLREVLEAEFHKYTGAVRRAKERATEYNCGTDLFLLSMHNVFKFGDYYLFNNIYQDSMSQGLFKDEMIEFVMFEFGMYSVNSFYFPAMNGLQFGNKFASRFLYNNALRVMNNKIKEQKKAERELDKKIIKMRMRDVGRLRYWFNRLFVQN